MSNNIRRITSRMMIRDTDPLVSEHRVNDIHILPGVALLDAVCKTLTGAEWPVAKTVYRDVLFHEPVVTHARMNRQLAITARLRGGQGEVEVHSTPCVGDRVSSEDETLHLTCRVALEADGEAPPWPRLEASPDGAEAVDLDACYAVTRGIGIHHENFMKCLGSVAPQRGGGCIADVQLGARAAACADSFLLHPVLLDNATIVPLFALREQLPEACLHIPFTIREFRSRGLAGETHVSVVGELPALTGPEVPEILRYSATIYGQDGEALALLRDFGVKRVRSLLNLERLLSSGKSSRQSARPSRLPVGDERTGDDAAEPAADDRLHALLGTLVAGVAHVDWTPAHASLPFFDLGLDSLLLLDLSEALESRLGVRLIPTLLFEHPTVRQLAAHLHAAFPAEVRALLATQTPSARTAPQPPPPHQGQAGAQAPTAKAAAQKRTPAPLAARDPRVPVALVARWVPADAPGELAPRRAQAGVALICGRPHPLQERLAQALGASLGLRCANATGAAEEISRSLRSGMALEEIWLVDVDAVTAFRIAQALLAQTGGQRALRIKSLSFNAFGLFDEAPAADAVHGVETLLKSLSREHPAIHTEHVDLDAADWVTESAPLDLLLATQPQRALRALREGRLLERRLWTLKLQAEPPGAFRQGGCYLVAGGAGGVGMTLVAHLRRRYDARVAIVGRRSADATTLAPLHAMGGVGTHLLYLQADLTDGAALGAAVEQAAKCFGQLHGVVHAAMVLDDAPIAEMTPARFDAVMAPKVAGMHSLDRATAHMPLDFFLVFSSMQSFVGNARQANYAAASGAIDGYAAAMRARRRHRVVVVNWGFWGEVGAVATPVYRQLLARQGVHGLATDAALQSLEGVLHGGWPQALIVAADDAMLAELGHGNEVTVHGERLPPAIDLPTLPRPQVSNTLPRAGLGASAQAAMAQLVSLAHRRVRRVLGDLGIQPGEAESPARALRDGRLTAEHLGLAELLNRRTDEPALSQEAFAQAADALVDAGGEMRHYLPLLRACVDALPAVLSGCRRALDVVFPNGSTDIVRAIYADSELSTAFNDEVARLVVALAGRVHGRRVRIVEIGGGTGATTSRVVQALEVHGVAFDYLFTDLWDKLIEEARDRLGAAHTSLRFAFFDVAQDPAAQGLSETADIVIATNVLHATPDLRQALRNAKALLHPGGALVLNESVEVQPFSTLTFGLLPGWWNVADRSERLPDSPLADTTSWTRLLRAEGFLKVQPGIEPGPTEPCLAAQQVFVAFSDGELRRSEAARRRAPEHAQTLPPALEGRLQPYRLGGDGPQPAHRQRHVRLYRDDAGCLWLLLDHAPANTFTHAVVTELRETLSTLRQEAPELIEGRLVFLSHLGEYFSLGGDRSEIMQRVFAGETQALASFAAQATELLTHLASMNTLVVAVVNGSAQGGGLETLLATDLQIVGEQVQLGLPEVKSGLIPGMGGLSYLRDQIGTARTKRLVMCGELVTARQAVDLGLVTHCEPDVYAAAFALRDRMTHLDAALAMKRVMARDSAQRHTADVDAWLAHVTSGASHIDARRIENAVELLHAKPRAANPPSADQPFAPSPEVPA